ncbi:MAG TPA: M23 family metallopeptidase [Coriobacteriia bacterium]|nr:M23 family metallopeptidase [Coriobacteriia bacterium]
MPGSSDNRTPSDPGRRRLPYGRAGSQPRKIIRSDRVHYDGLDDRLNQPAGSERSETARTLRPVRDAGLSIERRGARDRRRAAAARRNRALASGLAVVALVVAGMGWRWISDQQAAHEPPVQRSDTPKTVIKASNPVAQPTPVFATYKSLKLHLPVPVDDLTEVGFHQASFAYALKLKTPLPDADISEAKGQKGTHRDLSKQEIGPDAVLTGSVLRMWRDRPGSPNTSVDVGADPGTTVIAPVTGTVVLVKKYNLYNQAAYPDYQIHIQPDGMPKVDCVLIHIRKPRVKAGDRVTAGITPLAVVRKFSDRMNMQLEHYTSGTGDHTHFQLNDATHPSYEGLDGAIKP